jgi:hypothetical protein
MPSAWLWASPGVISPAFATAEESAEEQFPAGLHSAPLYPVGSPRINPLLATVDDGISSGAGEKVHCPVFRHAAGASVAQAKPIMGAWETHGRLAGHSPGITFRPPGAPSVSAGPRNPTRAYGRRTEGSFPVSGPRWKVGQRPLARKGGQRTARPAMRERFPHAYRTPAHLLRLRANS